MTKKNHHQTTFFEFITTIIIVAIVVIILFSPIYFMSESTRDTVIEKNKDKKLLFQKNKIFICKESSRAYSNAQIVSKDNNWSIYDEYFKKDKVLLSIANCNLSNNEDN